MLGCKNLKLFAISFPLQCRDLCQYREVSTSTILPNFTGNCRDSFVFAFGRGISKRERKRMSGKHTSVYNYSTCCTNRVLTRSAQQVRVYAFGVPTTVYASVHQLLVYEALTN